MVAFLPIVEGLLAAARPIIERFFPDPQKRLEFEAAMRQLEAQGQLEELKTSMSAIIAEAQSEDPWTSRARPTFLYVVYLYMLAAFPVGVAYALAPEHVNQFTAGLRAWLTALPEAVWWLFGAGYLGYSGARSFDKFNTVRKPGR